MKELLAIIAAGLAVAGSLPYLRDALMGRVRPHPYTWLVWSIVSCIVLFGMLAKGAGIGVLPIAAAEACTVLIFLSSLRFGLKEVTRLDALFLVAALAGLIPWALTNDPTLSVVMAVGIDLIAFAPTLRKAWVRSSTEAPHLYAMNVLRHVLVLLSLQTYNVATMLHSLAMMAANTVMVAILRLRKGAR